VRTLLAREFYARWKEDEHPRADDGKFSESAGGGSSPADQKKSRRAKRHKLSEFPALRMPVKEFARLDNPHPEVFESDLGLDDLYEKFGKEVVRRAFGHDRIRESEWKEQVRLAIATGAIDAKVADKMGFFAVGVPDGIQGVVELPEKMYHATTASDAVRETGLKSRVELGQEAGLGLGGGDDDTVSFTEDKEVADAIVSLLKEGRKFARGEITPQDLVEDARTGGSTNGKPFLKDLISMWDRNWEEGDEFPPGMKRAMDGTEYRHGWPKTAEEMKDEKPKDGAGEWRVIEGAHETAPGKFAAWERAQPPEDALYDRFQMYKNYLTFREYAGGPMNPGFFLSDPEALANIDESQIKTVEVSPVDGAQGHQMSALGEWRTWSGDAVDIVDIYRKQLQVFTDRSPLDREFCRRGFYKRPFDESKIKRDEGGRFSTKAGTGKVKTDTVGSMRNLEKFQDGLTNSVIEILKDSLGKGGDEADARAAAFWYGSTHSPDEGDVPHPSLFSKEARNASKAALNKSLTERMVKRDPSLGGRSQAAHPRGRHTAERAVRMWVDLWATTSADEHLEAIAMQLAAAEEFGMDPDPRFEPEPLPDIPELEDLYRVLSKTSPQAYDRKMPSTSFPTHVMAARNVQRAVTSGPWSPSGRPPIANADEFAKLVDDNLRMRKAVDDDTLTDYDPRDDQGVTFKVAQEGWYGRDEAGELTAGTRTVNVTEELWSGHLRQMEYLNVQARGEKPGGNYRDPGFVRDHVGFDPEADYDTNVRHFYDALYKSATDHEPYLEWEKTSQEWQRIKDGNEPRTQAREFYQGHIAKDMRNFVRSQYENTQDKLKEMGFKPGDTITLFRGMNWVEDGRKPPEGIFDISRDDLRKFVPSKHLHAEALFQPMSSYSMTLSTATSFASGGPNSFARGTASVVAASHVPIEAILSMPTTGVGCLTESEVVVMPHDGDTHFWIDRVGEDPALRPEEQHLVVDPEQFAGLAYREHLKSKWKGPTGALFEGRGDDLLTSGRLVGTPGYDSPAWYAKDRDPDVLVLDFDELVHNADWPKRTDDSSEALGLDDDDAEKLDKEFYRRGFYGRKFDESKIKRDKGGRFATKAGGGKTSGGGKVVSAKEGQKIHAEATAYAEKHSPHLFSHPTIADAPEGAKNLIDRPLGTPMPGDCYPEAGRLMLDNMFSAGNDDFREMRLVHGTVTMGNIPIAHAWVEIGDVVYDGTHTQFYDKASYYQFCDVSVEHTYDDAEMAGWMSQTEHWGPWEDTEGVTSE